MSIKTSDVEKALRDLISMTYSQTVDESGYVVDARDCVTKLMVESADTKGDKRAMVIYKETPPSPVDYFSLNPFSEGNGANSPSTNFFYMAQRAALFMRMVRVIGLTVRFMQHQNGVEFDDPRYAVSGSPKCLLDAAAGTDVKNKPIANLVDAKTYDNIMSYFTTKVAPRNFIAIAYNKKLLRSHLSIEVVTNPDFGDADTDVGKMRKSDITVLKGVVMAVLGLKTPSDIEQYSATSTDPKAPPKMDSWLAVLFKVYARINPILALVGDGDDDDAIVVDLEVFRNHLDKLPLYAGNAKWQIQANLESSGGGDTQSVPRVASRDERNDRTVPRVRPNDDDRYRDDRRDDRRRDRDDRYDDRSPPIMETRSGVPVMVDPRDRGYRDGGGYRDDRYRDDRYRNDRGYRDDRYRDDRDYRRRHRPDSYMPAMETGRRYR